MHCVFPSILIYTCQCLPFNKLGSSNCLKTFVRVKYVVYRRRKKTNACIGRRFVRLPCSSWRRLLHVIAEHVDKCHRDVTITLTSRNWGFPTLLKVTMCSWDFSKPPCSCIPLYRNVYLLMHVLKAFAANKCML